ncbi:MAG: hypothetical protein H6684_13265 [Deltaproteobacteria bacterium]|nr:hypothetical protein [Deltaproteobacteria bacterium]MCB9489696.1 hypothetical protein [Deltaproteobacteria bacterium]
MAHAYTPGLKVTTGMTLRKRRILPLKGEVVVRVGQDVAPDDVVARTSLPGDATLVNVAGLLGVSADEVPDAMVKKVGEHVEKDEILAEAKSFFGLFKSNAKSTMTGTVEDVNKVTGQVLLRGAPVPVEVKAYVRGKVVEIVPEEGCVVETYGTFVQGIFGIGGETHGPLVMACESPDQHLTPERIKDEHAGAIIVGGNLVTAEALKKAIKIGVKGVVAGGFHDKDLKDFLGYDLGVAITGHETLGVTLVVTEGFGQVDMAKKTYDILAAHEGREACVNGATQIRAGVIRPEVVIPMDPGDEALVAHEVSHGLDLGAMIRVIRVPYFGRIGKVTSLPAEPVVLDSESKARILEVHLDGDPAPVQVPRANVELIES